MNDVPAGKTLVLFDGDCNVCNASVLFIIDRDPQERFVFAQLASELGKHSLQAHGLLDPALDSIVVIDGPHVHTHSSAVLYVARYLSGFWPLFACLRIVPKYLRDAVYRGFAKRRIAWFGRRAQCRVPTPALQQRFLS
jgi:predicted DCC family thiol-disulfide oxidoreductase YuxK